MKGRVFISYRRASDQWALEQVRQKLMEEYGEDNVFFDTHSIAAGAEWLAELDRQISSARAVLVLYCRAWYGHQPDGSRRIDAADDMVRRELELAHAHGRPVIPVITDLSPAPGPDDLPHALHFLLKRQFLPLPPDELLPTRMHRLVQAIDAAQPGRLLGRPFLAQVSWLALVVTSVVAAWQAHGGSAGYDNGFARRALALRATLGFDAAADPAAWPLPFEATAAGPARAAGAASAGSAAASDAASSATPPAAPAVAGPELAVIDIDEAEFRTLLGGQRPPDPQVMAVVLRALQAGSRRAGACGPQRPVALQLDLAPDTAVHDERAIDGLNQALLALAECRPVVLACPASVTRRVLPDEDLKWMAQLLHDAPRRLMFTQATPDPTGLRPTRLRTDIGIVAADIAAGTPLPALRDAPERACTCPSSAQALAACESVPAAQARDRAAVAVPYGHSAYTLAGALLDMPRVAAARIVLVGGAGGSLGGASGGSPSSSTSPAGRESPPQATSNTLMQGYLAHGATRHAPLRVRPWMLLLAGALSWLLAAAVLAGALKLERHDDRFARRVPVYLGLGALMLGTPLLALLVAARWPALTALAGVVAVLGLLTIGRALLASFELVLAGQITWRGFGDLWKDLRFELDKGSALLRLAGAGLEAALVLLCLGLAFW